jgi:hypothetical protein
MDSLVEILGRFWVGLNFKRQIVHQRNVLLSVPGYASMSVLAGESVVVDLILLQQVEEGLIATEADASELVVVPLGVENIFDVRVLVSAENFSVLLGTVSANEDTQPDQNMGCLVLLAVQAVFIVRIAHF